MSLWRCYVLCSLEHSDSSSSFIATGVDAHGSIRSIPLPNLTYVTRQAAKEYFDNSWTLYETMFAGLKGEEGFYR